MKEVKKSLKECNTSETVHEKEQNKNLSGMWPLLSSSLTELPTTPTPPSHSVPGPASLLLPEHTEACPCGWRAPLPTIIPAQSFFFRLGTHFCQMLSAYWLRSAGSEEGQTLPSDWGPTSEADAINQPPQDHHSEAFGTIGTPVPPPRRNPWAQRAPRRQTAFQVPPREPELAGWEGAWASVSPPVRVTFVISVPGVPAAVDHHVRPAELSLLEQLDEGAGYCHVLQLTIQEGRARRRGTAPGSPRG